MRLAEKWVTTGEHVMEKADRLGAMIWDVQAAGFFMVRDKCNK